MFGIVWPWDRAVDALSDRVASLEDALWLAHETLGEHEVELHKRGVRAGKREAAKGPPLSAMGLGRTRKVA